MSNAQRLPKQLNDGTIPNQIKLHGITDSMSYEEKREIIKQNKITYTKEQYKKMGIVVINEYDDLQWNVKLPDGWEIKNTSHPMWNDLIDDKGRKRANIFCKNTCYDRDTFINFRTRYTTSADHMADPSSDYHTWKMSDYQGVVKDGDTVIFSTECVQPSGDYKTDDKIKENLQKKLDEYMKKNYPDHKNIHAYWD